MHTIKRILAHCPHQISPCHHAKVVAIDQALQTGTPFTALGGKHVRSRKGFIRFKVGRHLRLIYRRHAGRYVADSLVTRQKLEHELKQKRQI